MTKSKKKLTNEELSKHFNNPFELVNHAIEVARHLVRSGHELSDATDRNSASLVLKKVLKERELEEKSIQLKEIEQKNAQREDKELPDPLLQAI